MQKATNEVQDFNLYMATGSKQYLEFLFICNVKNILISFAYPDPWAMKNLIRRNNINLICDSGAFTSWNLSQGSRKSEAQKLCKEKYGKEFEIVSESIRQSIFEEVDKIGNWKKYLVNIDAYIEHLNKYKDIIFKAVNLDVIPGEQGIKPTQEQIIESAEQGWKNYLYLKSKGWNTIHVFHEGEPYWVLDRMLKDCDYIGVSPCNDSSEPEKLIWMDYIFRYISNSCNPKIKTHGFAVTSKKLVDRYPWFSVDSSSYSLTAAMGSVLTPYGRIYVSDQNLTDQDHILMKPEPIKKHINNYFMDEFGYGIASMTKNTETYEIYCKKCYEPIETISKIQSYKARNFANIIYFLKMQEERRKNGPTLDYLKQSTLF